MTGARLKRIEGYITGDEFMVTYGDGLSDVDIKALVKFHQSNGKLGTVTGVRPPSRFGELVLSGDSVDKFSEKPHAAEGLINGGFFVFSRGFFDYVADEDTCTLEGEPLERLSSDGQLGVFRHEGFWQPIDTQRELEAVNAIWKTGRAPW